MHHRAIGHFPFGANGTPLSSRALKAINLWSRCISNSRSKPIHCPTSSPSHIQHQLHNSQTTTSPQPSKFPLSPSLLHPRQKYRPFVAYVHPEEIQDSDLQRVDPGRSFSNDLHYSSSQHIVFNPPWCRKHKYPATFDTKRASNPLPIPLVPPPKTRVALYRNLLYLLSLRDPISTLPALLDYHDSYSGLRSTRSYNLLIAQALRHASFGTVQWLLKAMKADGLSGNLETWKLKVRWLIQTGWWDQAWNEVMDSRNLGVSGSISQKKSPIPPQIWLEFLKTLKHASVRRHRADRRQPNNSLQTTHENQPDTLKLHVTRYRTLVANYSALVPKELAQASPRTIYLVVMAMLKAQQSANAFSFTQAYFKALPPYIPGNWARICQDIIHLHMALGSTQRGLRKLYECRRTMVTLTKTHSALKPTSTTLFLLLSPLRHAKRCGTVAWNVCKSFKRQWGIKTMDRRVRRRVAAFAVKEGRMDIVDKVLVPEKTLRWAHGMWKRTTLTLGVTIPLRPRRLLRPPEKKLFRYNGREERLWQLLRQRRMRMTARKRNK